MPCFDCLGRLLCCTDDVKETRGGALNSRTWKLIYASEALCEWPLVISKGSVLWISLFALAPTGLLFVSPLTESFNNYQSAHKDQPLGITNIWLPFWKARLIQFKRDKYDFSIIKRTFYSQMVIKESWILFGFCSHHFNNYLYRWQQEEATGSKWYQLFRTRLIKSKLPCQLM